MVKHRSLKLALKKTLKKYYLYLKNIGHLSFRVSKCNVHDKDSIFVVSHDMSRTGAPMLLLHIVKKLHQLGWHIVVVSPTAGPLVPEFSRYAEVHLASNAKSFASRLSRIRQNGTQMAIVNSAVSGSWCPSLNKADFEVVSLVHELPGAIHAWDAVPDAKLMAEYSKCVVFPSTFVRDKFNALVEIESDYIVRPQGLFLKSKTALDRSGAGQYVRKKLNLNENPIVLNVATGNYRKGFDLFASMAAKAPELNFVWVGDVDDDILTQVSREVGIDTLQNLHLIGYVSDLELLLNLYSASHVMALTSREEPFGSIVLESMNAGTPIVGFRDVGGFQDVVRCNETGFLVELPNIDDMLAKIMEIVRDEELAKLLEHNCKQVVESFSFDKYVATLIACFEK
ncbi:glycosyltransferase family 4 protein [Vibrio vulnificus]|nr:glycosyltransferase family 4 protein [Vibrio vulnificus]EIH1436760.1 glycosyltransferase family 4 protein [Vibrio vulnificus]